MNKPDADRLHDFRRACRLSQDDMARRIGVSQSALSLYERGQRPIPEYVFQGARRTAARALADEPATRTACKYREVTAFGKPSGFAGHLAVCPACLRWAFAVRGAGKADQG